MRITAPSEGVARGLVLRSALLAVGALHAGADAGVGAAGGSESGVSICWACAGGRRGEFRLDLAAGDRTRALEGSDLAEVKPLSVPLQ